MKIWKRWASPSKIGTIHNYVEQDYPPNKFLVAFSRKTTVRMTFEGSVYLTENNQWEWEKSIMGDRQTPPESDLP